MGMTESDFPTSRFEVRRHQSKVIHRIEGDILFMSAVLVIVSILAGWC